MASDYADEFDDLFPRGYLKPEVAPEPEVTVEGQRSSDPATSDYLTRLKQRLGLPNQSDNTPVRSITQKIKLTLEDIQKKNTDELVQKYNYSSVYVSPPLQATGYTPSYVHPTAPPQYVPPQHYDMQTSGFVQTNGPSIPQVKSYGPVMNPATSVEYRDQIKCSTVNQGRVALTITMQLSPEQMDTLNTLLNGTEDGYRTMPTALANLIRNYLKSKFN